MKASVTARCFSFFVKWFIFKIMKIQGFLEKIYALKNLDLDKNTDLENLVTKISLSENKIQFKIEDLFKNQELNTPLFFKIEQTLDLIFIKDQLETNVCFANHSEVRPEFKQSFTLVDLFHYMYAFAHSFSFKESGEIVISEERDLFWKLIETTDK